MSTRLSHIINIRFVPMKLLSEDRELYYISFWRWYLSHFWILSGPRCYWPCVKPPKLMRTLHTQWRNFQSFLLIPFISTVPLSCIRLVYLDEEWRHALRCVIVIWDRVKHSNGVHQGRYTLDHADLYKTINMQPISIVRWQRFAVYIFLNGKRSELRVIRLKKNVQVFNLIPISAVIAAITNSCKQANLYFPTTVHRVCWKPTFARKYITIQSKLAFWWKLFVANKQCTLNSLVCHIQVRRDSRLSPIFALSEKLGLGNMMKRTDVQQRWTLFDFAADVIANSCTKKDSNLPITRLRPQQRNAACYWSD